MKTQFTVTVDKWTNALPHCKVSAWYVHTPAATTGQFHSEQEAAAFATQAVTSHFLASGLPLDAQAIKERIAFTHDGQGIDLHRNTKH